MRGASYPIDPKKEIGKREGKEYRGMRGPRRVVDEGMDDDTHQISRRRCDSLSATRLSTSAISHARPVWSGIEPRLRAASAGADAGGVPTIMSMSMNGARRPAFGHFAAVGVDSGNFSVVDA